MSFSVNRNLRWGLVALGGLMLAALLADFLSPYDPIAQHRESAFAPPARLRFVDAEGRRHWRPFVYAPQTRERIYPLRLMVRGAPYRLLGVISCERHLFGVEEPARVFLLGSDALGRDVLSRLLHGARLSLTLAGAALLISLPLALLVGGLSGFYGGWVDYFCMRLIELFLALPALYLVIALRGALPLSLPPEKVFIAMVAVLGVFGWAGLARIVRGATLSLRRCEFVLAAESLGASTGRILFHHIWPNLAGIVFTQAALAAPGFILAEVMLSYLGLGVTEPLSSWGGMLAAAGGVHQLAAYWWNLSPGAAVFAANLTFYLLAEGLREYADPRLQSPD